jgi:hypothetical protein
MGHHIGEAFVNEAVGMERFWAGDLRTSASRQQTFASRHKWATVHDIKDYALRTSLQSVIAVRLDSETVHHSRH